MDYKQTKTLIEKVFSEPVVFDDTFNQAAEIYHNAFADALMYPRAGQKYSLQSILESLYRETEEPKQTVDLLYSWIKRLKGDNQYLTDIEALRSSRTVAAMAIPGRLSLLDAERLLQVHPTMNKALLGKESRLGTLMTDLSPVHKQNPSDIAKWNPVLKRLASIGQDTLWSEIASLPIIQVEPDRLQWIDEILQIKGSPVNGMMTNFLLHTDFKRSDLKFFESTILTRLTKKQLIMVLSKKV